MIGFGTVINSVSVVFIAMVVAIQDGLRGVHSTLAVNWVRFFFIVGVMTEAAVAYLSLIGSVQPICPGSFRTLMRERIG